MLGAGEILVILLVALLLFGGKRLPELARSLGQGIREFKKASQEITNDIDLPASSPAEVNKNSKIISEKSTAKDKCEQ